MPSTDPMPSVGPRRGWRLARAGALLAAGALLLAACGLNPFAAEGDFGPLAVLEDPGGWAHEAYGGTGPIDIGDRCVTLEREDAPGRPLLLVWRSGEVRWDDARREILFTSQGDPTLRIRDGDTVSVGGSGVDAHDDRLTDRWASPPDPRCVELAELGMFGVHSVEVRDPDREAGG